MDCRVQNYMQKPPYKPEACTTVATWKELLSQSLKEKNR